MHHFFEAITNNKGDALTGYYVRVLDQTSGNPVTIYADISLTPIISVSGVANAAKVDADGNVDFYVAVGNYDLAIYATDSTTLVHTVRDVAMNNDVDTGVAAAAAQVAAAAAVVSQSAAAGSAINADNSLQTLLAAISAGEIRVFASTANALSNGVIGYVITAAGTGGTNGSYSLTLTGGGGTGGAAKVSVVGGALTQVTKQQPGINYTSAPTVSFTVPGIAGSPAITAVIGANTVDGDYFQVPDTAAGNYSVYKNVAAAAVFQFTTPVPDARIDFGNTPRNPLGLWAIDSYNSLGSNYFIPNRAASSQTRSLNLLRAPRRGFASPSPFWARTNVTAVDNAATGRTAGLNDATTLVCTGAWFLTGNHNAAVIPAGTYTLVADVMRSGGSDQPFALTRDRGATRITTDSNALAVTATSAFQRFVYTFTVGAAQNPFNLGLCSSDGVAGANLIVNAVELFVGSVDLGLQPQLGHLYLGKAVGAAAPAYASGILSSSNNNVAFASLPNKLALTKWSHSMLIEQTALNASGGIEMADLNSLNNWNMATTASTGTPAGGPMSSATNGQFIINNVDPVQGVGAAPVQRGGYMPLIGRNYHLLTRTYDGVTEKTYLDDILLFQQQRTLAARNLQDFLAFTDVNGLGNGLNIGGLKGLWDRALTVDEIRNWFSYQKLRNPSLSIPGLRSDNIIIFEGDSHTGSQGSECWAWQLAPLLTTRQWFGSIYAVGGGMLDQTNDPTPNPSLTGRAPFIDAIIPPDTYGRIFALSVAIGTNGNVNATFTTNLRAYCMARKAAGYEVLLSTIPKVVGNAAHNAAVATANTDIRTNWALYGLTSAARVIDVAGDATLNTAGDGGAGYLTYYNADGKHLTSTGYAIWAALAATAFNLL